MTGAAAEMAGFVWISLFGGLDSVGQKNYLNSLYCISLINIFFSCGGIIIIIICYIYIALF